MLPVEIHPDIHWIGVNDRTTRNFEGIWSIELDGIAYNSYLIADEKKTVIDLVKAYKADELFDHLDRLVGLSNIDYVVVNHMEPDHTGAFQALKKLAPNVTVLLSAKAREMMKEFYGITENVRVVEDGEVISLGRHELRFIYTPYVHWPETMMTFETTRQVLFPTDGFAGFGLLKGAIFDDTVQDLEYFKEQALRYFVNVISKFHKPVLKAIEKISDLPVRMIAPAHGLIWRREPREIIELYRRWAQYGDGPREKGVTLIYGSIYGNTETMMEAVAQGLADGGVPFEVFEVESATPSEIMTSLWTKRGVVVGAPTYEGGLFPPVAHVLDLAVAKRISGLRAAAFGSYGWGGGGMRQLQQIVEPLKWEMRDILTFTGGPAWEDLRAGREFGRRFARGILEEPGA